MPYFYKDDKGQEKVNYQEFRKDGKNCFVEIISNMMYLEKSNRRLMFNFVSYGNDNKMTYTIPIYIKMDEAMALASYILYGEIERERIRVAKTNKTVLYSLQGGTNVASLQKQKRPRKDGKCEARIFTIEVGRSQPYILKAQVGPGQVQVNGKVDNSPNAKGLYVPCGKPDHYTIIGCTRLDLIAFANAIKTKIESMAFLDECSFQKKLREYYKKNNIEIHF